jgi:hypothetical protein
MRELQMARNNSVDAMTKLVEILTPLPSEERARVIRAALVLLGEAQSEPPSIADTTGGPEGRLDEHIQLPPRARAWIKQNGISDAELQQVFLIADGRVEVIASHMPGKNKKEQTHNAYILTGIGELLLTGNASFLDKSARALCESSGCYDRPNHSANVKERGNEFSGTKERGWVLTAPGLKRAAEIIKDMNKLNA